MSATEPATEFQFVNATIDAPTVPQDLAIRALIRKQAMKKASAARRRDGNYGKHNLRQYPIFLFDQPNTVDIPTRARTQTWQQGGEVHQQRPISAPPIDAPAKAKEPRPKAKKKENERQQWIVRHAMTETVPRDLPVKGYEQTSMKSDFDILDLSTLATLHVGRAARGALSRNPYHLIYQLRSFKQWSYLSFVPSVYGQIPCLSDATDCVIARARSLLSPNRKWEAAVITFYMKALNSLQKALDCPKQRFKPEVLCATEILALYELLDPAGEMAWIRHAAGAARLIQLRGPQNYNTEFEKALFMAHTGPIMTEALLNNERCFLEQPAWKAVFRSVIVEDALISDRSDIVIELMILKSNIPGLFVDVTNILYDPAPSRTHINTIASTLQQLRVDLLKWHADYESLLSNAPPIVPGSAEYDRRCKVFATYLSCLIISSRLLGALSPTERVELELETKVLATQMLNLELEVHATLSAAGMFMAQTLGVAQATMASSEDWLQGEMGARRSISAELRVEKLESVSPEAFTSDISVYQSEGGIPSAGFSSTDENFATGKYASGINGAYSEGLPSAVFAYSEGFSSSEGGLTSAGFSASEGFSKSSASWEEESPGERSPEPVGVALGLIERWKLDGWCKMMNRKMPMSV